MFEKQLEKGIGDVSYEQLTQMNSHFKKNYIQVSMKKDQQMSSEISKVKNDAQEK